MATKTTAAGHGDHLKRRVRELREWFHGTLEVCELRDPQTIDTASKAFLAWAEEGWDLGAGDTFGALTHSWEVVPEFVSEWVRKPAMMDKDFSLTAFPPWEPVEVALLAGYAYATVAEVLLDKAIPGGSSVVAMIYADATEARAYWMDLRGHARCRNTDTKVGRVLKDVGAALKAREKALDRIESAKNAAKARRAKDKDGKQAAKKNARVLWVEWQASMHPKIRTVAQYAAEVMRRWPVLTSAKVIEGWSAEWTKQARAGKAKA